MVSELASECAMLAMAAAAVGAMLAPLRYRVRQMSYLWPGHSQGNKLVTADRRLEVLLDSYRHKLHHFNATLRILSATALFECAYAFNPVKEAKEPFALRELFPIGGNAIQIILPGFALLMWLSFGYSLSAALNARLSVVYCIHDEFKERFGATTYVIDTTIRSIVNEAGFLDLWFRSFYPQSISGVPVGRKQVFRARYTGAIAYGVILGVHHGATLAMPLRAAVGSNLWWIVYASILFVLLFLSHLHFAYFGRHPNTFQPLVGIIGLIVMFSLWLSVEAFAIRGLVMCADDSRPPRTLVEAFTGSTSGEAQTGPDGTFRIELGLAGDYFVRTSAAGLLQEAPVPVSLSPKHPTADVIVRLIAPTTIAGHVRWSTAEPAIGARVSAYPNDKEWPHAGQMVAPYAEFPMADTDAEGRFLLKGVHPALTYELSVIAKTPTGVAISDAVSGVTPGRQDVEVLIDRATLRKCGVAGTVVDENTRAPVPDFQVSFGRWLTSMQRVVEPRAIPFHDPSGHFGFAWMRAIPVGFEVSAEGYVTKMTGPLLITDEDLSLQVTLRHN